ncbi:unnamed protein product [Heligmosomoides polygyrus]|uniref:Secreted protein n=1 Tax=Heligmosomoides polygyrus TaxID=6339 RepID=A0A183FY34_HELPZ|nr:unnamed protein product [Heligmosomoides polygyrus]
MPTAVFCSLLAGISAVIEIHYSIDFNHLEWSEKWSWAAVGLSDEPRWTPSAGGDLLLHFQADSVALSAIHAILAFALQ